MEKNVTYRKINGEQSLVPCRIEQKFSDKVWERIWSNAKVQGLPSEFSSFVWRMIHDLLPTKQRLFRLQITGTPSDLCTHCSKDKTEDLVHALFECDFNGGSGPFLLNILKDVSTTLHPQQLLLLDLDLADERRLPVVYSISCVLSCIWRHRLEKKSIDTHKVRATMEASINILRKSRFRKSAEMVDRWLEKI